MKFGMCGKTGLATILKEDEQCHWIEQQECLGNKELPQMPPVCGHYQQEEPHVNKRQ